MMYFIGITLNGEKIVGCGYIRYNGRHYIIQDNSIAVQPFDDSQDKLAVYGNWKEVREETVMCYDPRDGR